MCTAPKGRPHTICAWDAEGKAEARSRKLGSEFFSCRDNRLATAVSRRVRVGIESLLPFLRLFALRFPLGLGPLMLHESSARRTNTEPRYQAAHEQETANGSPVLTFVALRTDNFCLFLVVNPESRMNFTATPARALDGTR